MAAESKSESVTESQIQELESQQMHEGMPQQKMGGIEEAFGEVSHFEYESSKDDFKQPKPNHVDVTASSTEATTISQEVK